MCYRNGTGIICIERDVNAPPWSRNQKTSKSSKVKSEVFQRIGYKILDGNY